MFNFFNQAESLKFFVKIFFIESIPFDRLSETYQRAIESVADEIGILPCKQL